MEKWEFRKKFYLECECGVPEHLMILYYFPDELEDRSRELYIAYHLAPYQNVLRRIWTAIRYVLGHRSRYGEFGEMLILPKQAQRLCDFIQSFLGGN